MSARSASATVTAVLSERVIVSLMDFPIVPSNDSLIPLLLVFIEVFAYAVKNNDNIVHAVAEEREERDDEERVNFSSGKCAYAA